MVEKLHAFRNDILGTLDGVGLAELIKKGDLSLQEVITATIERALLVNQDLNAFLDTDFSVDSFVKDDSVLGFFAQIPTFIKDNIPTKGFATYHGSKSIGGHKSPSNDPFLKQFLKTGFTVIGKSRMPEFGFNASAEQDGHLKAVRNPWNLDFSAGGSSSGAAALVAAGVVPIAHGNDGGGSIRIPASSCGLVGLKVSRRRHVLTAQGRMQPLNISVDGVLTRSVRDTAYFHAMMEQVYSNPKLKPIGLVKEPSAKRLRVGFFTDPITDQVVDPCMQKAVLDTAKLLEGLGHHVEQLDCNPIKASIVDDFIVYWEFLAYLIKNLRSKMRNTSFNPEQLTNLTKGLADSFKKHVLQTPLALVRLKRAHYDYSKIFEKYDVILCPTTGYATPKLGYLGLDKDFKTQFDRLVNYAYLSPLSNITGAPSISLPMGRTLNNMPLGVQFMGNVGEEALLLALAYELEEAQPWNHIFVA